MDKHYKIRLKKGDTVMVRAGKYKGKTGKISIVHPSLNMVTIEGINVVKKHVKPNKEHPQGDIIELTKPLPVSKVGYYDATSKKMTRIGYATSKEGVKQRIMKRTGKEIK